MKNNPALPGGLLKSKPTWPNAFGCWATSVFCFRGCGTAATTEGGPRPISKGRLIMYIGGGLVTLVIVVLVILFVLRR